MSMLRMASVGLILYTLPCTMNAPTAFADPPAEAVQSGSQPTAKLVIASADLTGSDRELGKFLTDTLITDLSRSTTLQPLERATVQDCFSKLDLSPERALTAGDVRKLGAAAGADRILVGSYLLREDQLVINARVLDARTGLVVPGGAMSASGNRKDVLSVTHRLARQLHKKLTDVDLVIEEDAPAPAEHPSAASGATGAAETVSNIAAPAVDDLQVLKSQGLIPAGARANAPLTDPDLAMLVKNVAKCVAVQSDTAATLSQNTGPVTRIRVLAAMVKLLVAPDDLANYKVAPPNHMPSDAAQLPTWGEPYLAAAVDQNWWPADRQICGKDAATWAFVAAVLTRLPLHQSPAHVDLATDTTQAPTSLPDNDSEPYSGLILDAADMHVERAMSPRIVDESGKVIYPDPGHVPSEDYIQDRGMVSYYTVAGDAKRAGRHPLVVHAIKVSDLGHDDFTVSNEAGELIREANRRGKFLWKWSVAVLVGSGRPQPQDAQSAPPARK